MRPLLTDAPRRKYGFALTPLADAMFQLLIFFMLSSSLAPYSLLTLVPGPRGNSDIEGHAAGAGMADTQNRVAIWHLSRGSIRAGQERLDLAELPALMAALKESSITQVVLFTTRSATVQDIATTLEALNVARVPTVQLVTGAEG